MICEKCGADLDDSAMFCDKCGSFVMRATPKNEAVREITPAGKRRRGRGNFWLYFKPTALIIVIAAGIVAGVMAYNAMIRDINQRMYGQPDEPSFTTESSPTPSPSAEVPTTAPP